MLGASEKFLETQYVNSFTFTEASGETSGNANMIRLAIIFRICVCRFKCVASMRY